MERAQLEVPALRDLSSEDSFGDLGLEPRVAHALHDAPPEIVLPTTLQSRTIPLLLPRHHLFKTVETGRESYLLLLLQRTLDHRLLFTHGVLAPRGLVLVPSRELGEQVQAVAKWLGSFWACRFKS